MKKKIFTLFVTITMILTLIPSAYADTYNNKAYVGKYLSAGATDNNYGMLEIKTCDSNTISVEFKFVKNGNQQLVYTCSPGVMNNTKGKIPFYVSYQSGQFVSNGEMIINLEPWGISMTCDSAQGQHLFDGRMHPEFELNPYNNQPGTQQSNQNDNVNVVINSNKIKFADNAKPRIVDDHTYVPLRSVFGYMGINVYWDQYKKNNILEAQAITCTKNDTIVQFSRTFNSTGHNVWTLQKWVGKNTDSSDFTRINITDLQPLIIDNTSYIPLRVVSEAFGADVAWIGETRTVDIICDTNNAYKYDTALIAKIEDYNLEEAKTYITSDFTSVIEDTTPYFSPQAKFYKFRANDTWGKVNLDIIYGGYIDVTPIQDAIIESPTPSPEMPQQTDTPVSEDDIIVIYTPTQSPVDETPLEKPVETETPVQTSTTPAPESIIDTSNLSEEDRKLALDIINAIQKERENN